MKIKKYKQSERGFAIVLALTMLVAMSLLAATILALATKEHVKNAEKDTRQQAFYAAETGISEAKRWLADNADAVTTTSPSSLDGKLIFCNKSFSNITTNGFSFGRKSLDKIITVSDDEEERLKKFSYEYFITYTPDADGDTSKERESSVAASAGSSITEGTSYKSSGTSTGTNFTIFSCGCNGNDDCKQGNNTIVKLIADVVLVK